MMKINKIPLLLFIFTVLAGANQGNVIDKIVIHGNHNTPDTEIIELMPVKVGDTVTEDTLADIQQILNDSGKFESVEVLLRYTSFDLDGPVAIVIKVVEHTSFRDSLLILPILGSIEGYGFSYGAQVTAVDLFGMDERISVPATWGGTKQIGINLNLDGSVPFADRFDLGLIYMQRDEHQVFDEEDERLRFTSEIGWNITDDLHVLGSYWYEDITYAGTIDSTLNTTAVSFVFDTRGTFFFPYDAVYASYTFSYLFYDEPYEDTFINDLDLRLYKRLFGQTVIAAQFQYQETDVRQPVFDRNFLGGDFFVRGFKEPDVVGDNFYLGSVELRMPMSEVSSTSKWGLTFFYDYAGLWNIDQSIDEATIYQGAGMGTYYDIGGILFLLEYAVRINADDILTDDDDDGEFHFRTFFKF